MTDIFVRPPRIYVLKLQKSFDVSDIDWINKTVTVKRIIVNDGSQLDEVINITYRFYEVESLHFVNKKDDTGKDLIQDDDIAYGDRLQYTGTIRWNNELLTWIIIPRENSKIYGSNNVLYDRLSEIDSKFIHFISHKHGEIE